LRTSFVLEDGMPRQMILEEFSFEIAWYHYENKPEEVVRSFVRPFDLSMGPLIRVGIAQGSDGENMLMIDMHHIIVDAISRGVLVKDFMFLYNEEALPELHLHYKDYAEWQNSSEQQEKLIKQGAFWKQEFATEPPVVSLPMDFPRPAFKTYSGGAVDFSLSPEETDALKNITRTQGTTLFMTLLSVYYILIGKLSNLEDVVIGTPTAGRHHSDLENMIGMFVNTLPLRNAPKEDVIFNDFLRAVTSGTLACFDNQEYQYEEMIEELKVVRDSSRNPLFDILFAFDNFKEVELSIPGLSLSQVKNNDVVSKFDLSLTAVEKNETLIFRFEYADQLFSRATIERFVSYFRKIISSVIMNPRIRIGDIEMMSESERQLLLHGFNDTSGIFNREATVISLFEAQVNKTPGNIAVICDAHRYTYAQINARASRLALYLRDQYGIAPGNHVAVMMHKSEKLIIAILAILKAGAAYLPIDPWNPADRIRHVLSDSEARCLITDDTEFSNDGAVPDNVLLYERLEQAVEGLPAENIPLRSKATDLFYTIYTSGSTGMPKGAQIRNNSFVNLVTWYQQLLAVQAGNNFLLVSPMGFDLTQKNIFTPLLHGAMLTLSERLYNDYAAIAAAIETHQVDILNCAPSAFYPLLDEQVTAGYSRLHGLKKVILGGEPVNVKLFTPWMTSGCWNAEIINSYGPTECTDVVSAYRLSASDFVRQEMIPVGRPVFNTQLYIVDNDLRLAPLGVKGEICIGGIGVSNGYGRHTELTGKKFINNPFGEGLLYKTGDLGYWRTDGQLVFTERKDNQVKIRGFRIELGEIENRLCGHKEIKEVVVMAREKEDGRFLAAYYVSGRKIEPAELRGYLSQQLPDYMMPSYFVHMQAMPLSANGKLNRNALPEPEPELGANGDFISPVNQTQKELIAIWADILGIKSEKISVNINFFDIGGDSLRLIKMVNRVNQQFGTDVSVASIFKFPVISQLAGFLHNAGSAAAIDETGSDTEEGWVQRTNTIALLNKLKN
jgi:amino acid adenylation domain-containing protein